MPLSLTVPTISMNLYRIHTEVLGLKENGF